MCVPSPSFEKAADARSSHVHTYICTLTFYLGLIASQMCVKTYLIPSSLFLISSIFTISIECSTYCIYTFSSVHKKECSKCTKMYSLLTLNGNVNQFEDMPKRLYLYASFNCYYRDAYEILLLVRY